MRVDEFFRVIEDVFSGSAASEQLR
jgi:hypothetical protein